MKTLQQIILLAVFLISTVVFGQIKETTKKLSKEKVEQQQKTKVDTKKLEKFVGKYNLSEANLELEIIQENDKMFIKSPWGKDPLKIQDENTLVEPTRGVYLTLIKDDANALKYFQNGYETKMKRVNP